EAAPPPQAAAPGAAPTTSERIVMAVWADVLATEIPGPDADFFDLGGHSLAAARAVSELRRVTGLRVGLGALLAEPTAAHVAAELDRLAAEREASAAADPAEDTAEGA
ncbi:phosphopantetheine-binding protein, partial [Streptomyces sp. NPDC059552]|uniref:phosphopantetheine-binding protein n=1 Tax=Streptomyces sp. NPDC059552 TaxID=3346862 RepID=UPI0036B8FE16